MKLLIAGSRTFEEHVTPKGSTKGLYSLFEDAARLLSIDVWRDYESVIIISGGARGIDTAAEGWASDLGLGFQLYAAQWDELGKRAGYVRNTEMAEACDVAILVWDGVSKGTEHMRNLLVKAEKPYALMYFPL